MRLRFIEQLEDLNNKLIEMGSLIEHAISEATDALIKQDKEKAEIVLKNDFIIDEKEREIENICLKLLLNQQPVAKDLRLISAALKMVTDMERIGDQAADISELCIYLSDSEYIKELNHISLMAEVTIKMVKESIDAFVKKDLNLAKDVISYDDEVDDLYTIVKEDLISLVYEDKNKGEQAFDLLQIAKYYERIGDHAVNIAEWVMFSIIGIHKSEIGEV